jgi:predicted ArsR family transcriptional regulator
MIRETSQEAYYSLKDLGERQRSVLLAIKELGTACNLDISESLGKPINAVTPRTNELVIKGLVKESHREICKTGRRVIYWRLSAYGHEIIGSKQDKLF